MATNMINKQGEVTIPDPPFAHKMLSTTKFAWLWTIIRVYLGWMWLSSGWGKVSNEAWMNGGTALKGFWERAVVIPDGGKPVIAYDWYRGFIQMMLDNEFYTWFAPLVVYGEILVGLGLIVGAFTGIAAFFGAFLNWNFLMAGTASTNGMLLVLAVPLILAWKVAGWYGLDRFLLPMVGTPWTWTHKHEEGQKPAKPTKATT